MKKNLRFVYILVCLGILFVSLVQIGRHYIDYYKAKNTYQQAENEFGLSSDAGVLLPSKEPVASVEDTGQPEETTEEETDPLLLSALDYFKDSDFNTLQEINPEIIAWIVIPDPEISYPVCKGSDNQYYLEHTFDKKYSRVGAIFADYRIKEPFAEKNTVLYGHHMRDKSMFAKLMNFQTKEVWENNRYVYICTPEEVLVYEIYSAFKGDPMGLSYHIGMTTEEDIQAYIDYTLSCANYKTKIPLSTEDRFLTLSTCTGSGHSQRMIVHCRLYGTISREQTHSTET